MPLGDASCISGRPHDRRQRNDVGLLGRQADLWQGAFNGKLDVKRCLNTPKESGPKGRNVASETRFDAETYRAVR